MTSLPTQQQPPFTAFVQFIGHVKTPDLLPGAPKEVIASAVYQCHSKAHMIELLNQEMQTILLQQGMLVARSDNPIHTVVEHILSVEYKIFVPMTNINYIETIVKPTTELPRVEEPGVPLVGQGVETKELKPS